MNKRLAFKPSIELLDDHFENSNFDPLIHHYILTNNRHDSYDKQKPTLLQFFHSSKEQWIIILIYWADSHLQKMPLYAA